MTTTTTTTDRKLNLIRDILAIAFPQKTINNLILENPQRVSFTIPLKEAYLDWVEIRFELVWNNDFDFEIWATRNRRVKQHFLTTSRWFKVRDLMRKRFMDSEKLKHTF